MRSIRIKLSLPVFLIVFIINIPIFMLILLRFKNSLTEVIYNNMSSVVENVAQAVINKDNEELLMLRTLAELPDIKDSEVSLYDKSQLIYAIFTAKKGDRVDMVILDAKGDAYINGSTKIVNFAERDYFKIPMTGKEYITPPFINKVDNTMAMFYAVPVYDKDKNIINVIFSVVDGYRYCNFVTNYTIGESNHPFIIDCNTGKVIGIADKEILDNGDNFKERAAAPDATPAFKEFVNEMLNTPTDDVVRYVNQYSNEESISLFRHMRDTINDRNLCIVAELPYQFIRDSMKSVRDLLFYSFVVMIAGSSFIIFIITGRITRPLTKVSIAVDNIGGGNADLSQRLHVKSNDEVGKVANGFNNFVIKLQNIIINIKGSQNELHEKSLDLININNNSSNAIAEVSNSINKVNNQIKNQNQSIESTASSMKQISANLMSFEKLIEDQTASVEEASASVEEMVGNISSVNLSVERMAASFENLDKDVQKGSEKQIEVNDRIAEIESQSETLLEANQAIAAIAEQTNLLAMNAAIEAAHAGEAGKGFSVVADEIRKLSETSTNQSKTIGVQLSKINELIASAVNASAESSKAFEDVNNQIRQTNDLVIHIKNAMDEQTTGSKQINIALHNMNDSTLEVKNASKEMINDNKNIFDEINNIKEAAEQIQNNVIQMENGSHVVTDTSTSLTEIVSQMAEVINKIENHVNQFKI